VAIHVIVLGAVCVSIALEGLDASRLGSVISLVLAMTFFGLKLGDVAFLRLRTRQQSCVAVCLLTAIVHHNAVVTEIDEPRVLQVAAVVVTAAAVHLALRSGPPSPRSWARRLTAQHVRLEFLTSALVRRQRRTLPRASVFLLSPPALRGPPA
jgi:hypothetical protein